MAPIRRSLFDAFALDALVASIVSLPRASPTRCATCSKSGGSCSRTTRSPRRGRWEKLTLFLRVPGAPLENICERILEKAILHLPADVEESPEDWMPWNYTNALSAARAGRFLDDAFRLLVLPRDVLRALP